MVQRRRFGTAVLGLLSFTFADPAFDAEFAINSVRFGKAVINIRAQSVEWDPTPVVLLDTGQFGATQGGRHNEF